MPAKSFIGEIETTARRFYAEVMRGEVNDANVRGFCVPRARLKISGDRLTKKLLS